MNSEQSAKDKRLLREIEQTVETVGHMLDGAEEKMSQITSRSLRRQAKDMLCFYMDIEGER